MTYDGNFLSIFEDLSLNFHDLGENKFTCEFTAECSRIPTKKVWDPKSQNPAF